MRVANPISNALAGAALLPRGLRLMTRRPRLLGLGLIPPLVVSLVFGAVFVLLAVNAMDLAAALTPFAADWGWVEAFRVLVAIALLVAAGALMVIAFSAVTLAVGSPLYDRIGEEAEDVLGDVPTAVEEPLLRSVPRTIRQVLTLVAISALAALPLFLLGLLPVVGTVVGGLLSAVFGGWMITTEMVGGGFERRGRFRLRDRWAAMRRQPARTLGFGVPLFLLLALPLVAIAVFPVASAAGTLLARELLAPEPGRPEPKPSAPAT
ncbi:hypothetical protein DT076_04975 [Desertihabitans brevis]|uniref:EI24 domain-containing protein n=1 Tax=Desertihabitans brevis TaxID=2268447 RepID=A0A367YXX2_9ACTN|nr:hypothetical protein DT076_04975 [Desertihabitans brevis]